MTRKKNSLVCNWLGLILTIFEPMKTSRDCYQHVKLLTYKAVAARIQYSFRSREVV